MTNHTLQKTVFQTGAILCALAVALGAFGAHLLRDRLEPHMFAAYETAVRYHFFHAFAILFMAAFMRHIHEKAVRVVLQIFLTGIVLFSGSLYIMAISKPLIGDAFKWMGGITPLGGIAFILGWLWLAFKGYKEGDVSSHRHRHSERKEESI